MKAPASSKPFRNSGIRGQYTSARKPGNSPISCFSVSGRELSLRIERLVDVHPDHARDPYRHGDKRQVCHHRADQGPLIAPPGKQPETGYQQEIRGNRKGVADVHGAHEIALLALEPEAADRAALIHGEPAAKQRAPIDGALAATRAALTANRDEES